MDGYGYTDVNRDGVINHSDAIHVPPGWDDWQAFVLPFPMLGRGGQVSVWWDNPNQYNYWVSDNGIVVPYGSDPEDYQTDVLAARAENYIGRSVGFGDSPFFLVVAPGAPHVECFPDQGTTDEYTDAWRWDVRSAPRHAGSVSLPLPASPNFNELDVTDKPAWIQEKALLTTQDISYLTRQYQDRLASLRAVDDLVGRLASALHAVGKYESTVLIFTSDNGWFYGEHRLSSKNTPHEESIRVPLYISLKGPATEPALVTNIDLAPTIAALAQARPSRAVDGVSLTPLLAKPGQRWRSRALIESSACGDGTEPFAVPDYAAVRTGSTTVNVPNQLYVSYLDGAKEFYDMAVDTHQTMSLHNDLSPDRQQQRQIHEGWLAKLRTCGNGSCQKLEFK
jgi:arylsulfatase A-like enzyme